MLFRNATFKHLPMLFCFAGSSFWIVKCVMAYMEGGLIDGIVGNFNNGLEACPKLRKKAACAIVECIQKSNTCGYLFKLIVAHILPIIMTAFLAYIMLHFLSIDINYQISKNLYELFLMAYNTPVPLRSDHLLELFPRKTSYEHWVFGPSGTYSNHDVLCIQSTASALELMFLTLTMQVISVFLVMVLEQFFTVQCMVLFARFANPHLNNDNTEKGKWSFSEMVVIFLVRKNVDALLMDEIWLEYSKNPSYEGARYEAISKSSDSPV